MGHYLEVLEPGSAPRVLVVDGPVDVQGVAFAPGPAGVVASVAASGAVAPVTVNGHPYAGAVSCGEGDWLQVGEVQVRVHEGEPSASRTTVQRADGLERLEAPGVGTVVFRPGSAGAAVARRYLTQIKRARRRLAGFGRDRTGCAPTFVLVDPQPDPDDPGRLLTEGTFVEAASDTVYLVVTGEAPPEAPERALSLLLGRELPAIEAIEPLVEGYGLWLAGSPDPREQLRGIDVPPLNLATGELRAAIAVSFVHFLIDREGESTLRRFLTEVTPATAEADAQACYGLGLAALDRAWRSQLDSDGPQARTGEFLRLSLRYLRPHKWKQAEIFLYMLVALGFNVAFPFVTRALFDNALLGGDTALIVPLLVGLAAVAAVSLAAGLRQAYLAAWVSSAVIRDLRTTMFTKLQSLPVSWFHRHQQGDVLTRLFSDVHVVESGLSSTLRDGIFQLLSMVVSAVVMLTLDWRLGILVLLGAPLVAFVYRRMSSGARKRGLAVQEDTSSLMGVAAENYQAGPVVKLFALEGREVDRFGQLSNRLFRSERRMSIFGGLFGLSVNSIVTVLRLAVLAIGSWMITNGTFTVGGLVAFLGIMGEVLAPVTVLTGIGQQVQAATGSLHRIGEITDEAPEHTDPPDAVPLPPLSEALVLDDIEFGYTPERPAVDDVSATVPAGTRVAFVGASGSGKSTLLQLIMRLYDPDDGSIRWDGIDLREAPLASLRSQLGVVFQESFLFDTSVRDNIALGHLGATDEEIRAAAAAAEVDEFIDVLPHGLDTVVGERGGMLSGGQRQRIAIARALVRNPRVLLLDEATSALDPKTERQITATLNRVAVGRTTIAITHRLTSVTDYDRIFVMDGGRLVEQGTHDELVARGGVYARLWSEQTGQAVPLASVASDAAMALGRVPLFSSLAEDELAVVGARLERAELAVGASMPDGDALAVVLRGRARVVVPGLGDGWSTTAELGPGDVFGVAALLGGAPTGAWLQATEPCDLAVLDSDAIDDLSDRYPAVSSARAGATAAVPVPAATVVPSSADGVRLTRITRVLTAEDLAEVRAAATAGAVREDDIAASRVFPRPR